MQWLSRARAHQVLLEELDQAHEAQDPRDARDLLQQHDHVVAAAARQDARPSRLRARSWRLLAPVYRTIRRPAPPSDAPPHDVFVSVGGLIALPQATAMHVVGRSV